MALFKVITALSFLKRQPYIGVFIAIKNANKVGIFTVVYNKKAKLAFSS